MRRSHFILFFLIGLCASLLTGCGEEPDFQKVNIHVQLNNFTNQKVFFWTDINSKKTLVDENSQYYRQEGYGSVHLENGSPLTVYVQIQNSSNAIDGQITLTLKAERDQFSEYVDVTGFCTWNGSSLTSD